MVTFRSRGSHPAPTCTSILHDILATVQGVLFRRPQRLVESHYRSRHGKNKSGRPGALLPSRGRPDGDRGQTAEHSHPRQHRLRRHRWHPSDMASGVDYPPRIRPLQSKTANSLHALHASVAPVGSRRHRAEDGFAACPSRIVAIWPALAQQGGGLEHGTGARRVTSGITGPADARRTRPGRGRPRAVRVVGETGHNRLNWGVGRGRLGRIGAIALRIILSRGDDRKAAGIGRPETVLLRKPNPQRPGSGVRWLAGTAPIGRLGTDGPAPQSISVHGPCRPDEPDGFECSTGSEVSGSAVAVPRGWSPTKCSESRHPFQPPSRPGSRREVHERPNEATFDASPRMASVWSDRHGTRRFHCPQTAHWGE